MPITRSQAKEICTKQEYELVEASFRPEVTKLNPARLRSKVVRARDLQEKYRELARSQQRERKETSPSRDPRNVRTERKAKLFSETRERFEKRLAQVEAKEDTAGAGASRGRAARQSASRQAAAERRKERRQAKRELR